MKPYVNWVAPKLLDWLEYFSPLGVGGDGIPGIANITLGCLIISAYPMSPEDENHEVIHIWQTGEVGLVGFLLVSLGLALFGAPWWAFGLAALHAWAPGIGWFGLSYGLLYLFWLIRLKLAPGDWTGLDAYALIPYEREAYLYDQDLTYLPQRRWFAWTRIGVLEALSDEPTRAKHVLTTIWTLRDSRVPGQ